VAGVLDLVAKGLDGLLVGLALDLLQDLDGRFFGLAGDDEAVDCKLQLVKTALAFCTFLYIRNLGLKSLER
jgi:hypothetical protein